MSTCFHGYGTFVLDKEKDYKKFADDLLELLKKYNGGMNPQFALEENHPLREGYSIVSFENYARHYFSDDLKKLLKENMEIAVEGFAHFNTSEFDGSPMHPAPYVIDYEIMDGVFHESIATTILDENWQFYNASPKWQEMLKKINKQEQKRERKKNRQIMWRKFTDHFKFLTLTYWKRKRYARNLKKNPPVYDPDELPF